jgi:hypothetical protein
LPVMTSTYMRYRIFYGIEVGKSNAYAVLSTGNIDQTVVGGTDVSKIG